MSGAGTRTGAANVIQVPTLLLSSSAVEASLTYAETIGAQLETTKPISRADMKIG